MTKTRKSRVVLLNDTSARHHHGCTRVMRLLTEGLERHGLTIIARSLARHRWDKDENFLKALASADVIVINGEGTLHHGKPAAELLLSVISHPARGRTPVALVNALYESNPPDWGKRYLSDFALLAARDSVSAAVLSQDAGCAVRWLPDLSLSAPASIPTGPRNNVVVGDSVKLSHRRVLARISCRLPLARYMPTKTAENTIFGLPVIGNVARWMLFCAYNGIIVSRAPNFLLPKSEFGYLNELAAARLHVTGRFHAVCMSMLTETPFLAIRSNSSKIERLLIDCGLDRTRLFEPSEEICFSEWAEFSSAQLNLVRAFRRTATQQAEKLFSDIARLGGVDKLTHPDD
jgi:polysaccharide pyruvyl transferase WcaK-like protein